MQQFKLFGYTLSRNKKDDIGSVQGSDSQRSFVEPDIDGGSPIEFMSGGFSFVSTMELEDSIRKTSEQIKRYRDIAAHPEADWAIEDICNEAITSSKTEDPVSIDLDAIETLSEKIKDAIREEFGNVLKLLNYNHKGYKYFRTFYIDGRLYFHKVVDENKKGDGIQELRLIDAAATTKVMEIEKQRDPDTNADMVKKTAEYFVYNRTYAATNRRGIYHQTLKIDPAAIAYVHTDEYTSDRTMLVGYLHKAIRPMNQLRMVEDASVVYRVTRAPERRVFYVDVGRLPHQKAEQVVKQVMERHRNKLQYNATTGELSDGKKHMHMLEDFFMPRREGNNATEITQLEGGQHLGVMDDVLYFQKQFYRALNVPVSRLEADSGFAIGRVAEISRDEVKFTKFVDRILKQFSHLFNDILGTQLILKNILRADEWDDIKNDIYYDFLKDSFFKELKETEILRDRLSVLQEVDQWVGKYFSLEWVKKNVLFQDEELIDEMQKQIGGEDKKEYGPTQMQFAQGMQPPDKVEAGEITKTGAPVDPDAPKFANKIGAKDSNPFGKDLGAKPDPKPAPKPAAAPKAAPIHININKD